MEKNNPEFMKQSEMSLDEWVDITLAPSYDTVYFISSEIRQVMDSFELDRGI